MPIKLDQTQKNVTMTVLKFCEMLYKNKISDSQITVDLAFAMAIHEKNSRLSEKDVDDLIHKFREKRKVLLGETNLIP